MIESYTSDYSFIYIQIYINSLLLLFKNSSIHSFSLVDDSEKTLTQPAHRATEKGRASEKGKIQSESKFIIYNIPMCRIDF